MSDRITIIARGREVAAGTPDELRRQSQEMSAAVVYAEVQATTDRVKAIAQKLSDEATATVEPHATDPHWQRLWLTPTAGPGVRLDLRVSTAQAFAAVDLTVRELRREDVGLEAFFTRVTDPSRDSVPDDHDHASPARRVRRMSAIVTLARRELIGLFASPIAWVVLALFALGTGLVFAVDFGPGRPATMATTFNATVWLLVFLAPAVSMRLLSEELARGTLERLVTSPVSDTQIVLGKWLASLVFLGLLLTPLLVQIGVLYLNGEPDAGPLIGGLWASPSWARCTWPWAPSPRPPPKTRSSPSSWPAS